MDLVTGREFREAKAFADQHCLPFFAVSAKTGENVADVFERLAEMILQRDPNLGEFSASQGMLKSKKEIVQEPRCCDKF
jgi:hypothetical protein